ncbi:hypothetical protein [Streptomyces sp. NBC_00470]|uniref:hypothetical protein n=1 Tax=Streptomyces sp. NBC_00470 TaxID=2975753 RepID=UPI0030E1E088
MNLLEFVYARLEDEYYRNTSKFPGALDEWEMKRQLIALLFRRLEAVDGEWGCGHKAHEISQGLCEDTPIDSIPELRWMAWPSRKHSDFEDRWMPPGVRI